MGSNCRDMVDTAVIESTVELGHKLQSLKLEMNLMQHQVQARDWMMQREMQPPYGGILADDMGLGFITNSAMAIGSQ